MKARPIETREIHSLLVDRVGFDSKEAEVCMGWTLPELIIPLKSGDKIVAELTGEEQGFLRCVGYAFKKNKGDFLRLTALHATFWAAVKNLRELPTGGRLTVKEGKYVVENDTAGGGMDEEPGPRGL